MADDLIATTSKVLETGRALRNFWGFEQPGSGCLPQQGKGQCLDPEG